jgi:hydroxyethylthiazole kinase-like uncharacterized protein yjeF
MMNGQMTLLRVRQMAEADRLTVAAGIPAIDMMEHAGEAVAREIARRWKVRPVIVLRGPGNNGGDGFVAARHLVEAGWPVRVALLGSRDHLAGEARYHAERWHATVEPLSPAVLDTAELVVDAIFGAGLSRQPEGPAAETLADAARRGLPIIAIDVPSGLVGDTGEALGAVTAVLTVTYFRKKPGHLLLPGRSLCGEVVVADPEMLAKERSMAERRGHDRRKGPTEVGPSLGTNRHTGETPQPHGDIRKIYERFRRNPHTPPRRRRPQSVQIGIARLPELLGKASASEQWLR